MGKVAAVQMTSGYELKDNLNQASDLITQATDHGAELVVLPENFAFMAPTEEDKLTVAEPMSDGLIQDFLSQQAKGHEIWLLGGSVPILSEDRNKVYAASLLYNSQGELAATYHKMHLFDVFITQSQEEFKESKIIKPGNTIKTVDTPIGRLGLTICYDLRFPEQFRALIDQGAEIITVPSAFTSTTGMAHWETLLRARAIENFVYMVAPNQWGTLAHGRSCYGHSMIVEPWGHIVSKIEQGAGIITADIDRQHLAEIRQKFPSLQHRV